MDFWCLLWRLLVNNSLSYTKKLYWCLPGHFLPKNCHIAYLSRGGLMSQEDPLVCKKDFVPWYMWDCPYMTR